MNSIKYKLSVIIPVYNVEKYLKECLQSILIQIDDESEIICVEDCSTDHSLEILRKYADEYNKIKIICHENNRGLAAARNTGLNNAKGQYILFVDSDDMLKSNAIPDLMNIVNEHELDQVFFNMEEFSEDGAWPARVCSYQTIEGIMSSMELYEKLLAQSIIKVESCRAMYRLEFLNKNRIRFLEGVIHEDNHFFYKCLQANGRVMDLNKEIYKYRHRLNSIMGQIYSGNVRKSIESQFIIAMDLLSNSEVINGTDYQKKLWRIGIYQMLRNVMEQRSLCTEESELITKQTDIVRNLYEFIRMKNELRVHLSDEKLRMLKNYKNVYVYGAGRIAEDIIYKLQNENVRIDKVVVTNRISDKVVYKGYRLVSIEEVEVNHESVVFVLAGNDKNRQSMKRELDKRNIKNFIEPEDV